MLLLPRRRIFLLPIIAIVLAGCAGANLTRPADVYAVRHAEKEKGPDPSLTAAGQARALALANLLEGRGVEAVYSSDTRRTRETAAPIAERLGVEVELYDPSDLDALVRALRARGGVQLVVGHSNTTPDLVARLGGNPGEPIREADEYDRLYLVTRDKGETVTNLLRYGE